MMVDEEPREREWMVILSSSAPGEAGVREMPGMRSLGMLKATMGRERANGKRVTWVS